MDSHTSVVPTNILISADGHVGRSVASMSIDRTVRVERRVEQLEGVIVLLLTVDLALVVFVAFHLLGILI